MKTTMVKAPLAAAVGAAVLGTGMLPLAAAEDEPASSTTVDLMMPMIGISDASWMGSVITAAPSATTYSIQCQGTLPEEFPQDPDNEEKPCGDITLAQGPSTWSMHWEIEGVITSEGNCSPFELEVTAVCEASVDMNTGLSFGIPATTMTTTNTMGELPVGPVTLTAGLDKLPTSTAPVTGSASRSASRPGSGSASGSQTASGTAGETATGTTEATVAPSSTDAAARCTGWMAAGGVAAVAAVAAAM